MFDKNLFPFSPEKFAEMFKMPDFSKSFDFSKFANIAQLPGVDVQKLVDVQNKNMEALIAANKAAAEGYQSLFQKQMAILEETVNALKAQFAADTAALSPEAVAKRTELAKAAMEKAFANMTLLADAAQKANKDAFELIAARVREGIEELKKLAA